MYKSLTYIVLNNEKFAPGTKLTLKQLQAAGQSKANIEQLIDNGALTKDLKAPLLPEHQPIELPDGSLIGIDAGVGNG